MEEFSWGRGVIVQEAAARRLADDALSSRQPPWGQQQQVTKYIYLAPLNRLVMITTFTSHHARFEKKELKI